MTAMRPPGRSHRVAAARASLRTSSSWLTSMRSAWNVRRARREGPHPARRTFQALRIEVNQELEVLKVALAAATRWLRPGGRIAVISYHSLEDRIVKLFFAEQSQTCVCPPELPVCTCSTVPVLRVLTRKAIVPSAEEIEANPRARSAKLRVAEKL